MDSSRSERAKELFEMALALAEPERSQFLAQACEDDEELRNEVESLISGSTQTGEVMRLSVARVPLIKGPAADIPSSTFGAGDVVAGRFRVRRFISHGGMGEVYEAEDLELGTRLALKTIRPEISSSPRTLARFKQEFQLACLVTHPNVCRLFHLERHRPADDVGKPEVWFLTMQLLEGETLGRRLRRQGSMTVDEALPLVRQMAEGLAAAHEAGVVHRDFKPGNVMLIGDRHATADQQQATQLGASAATPSHPSAGGVRAVITDFGLARSVLPTISADGAPTLSGIGQTPGTPAYMAPEQMEGREITPATDIYALGLVMYEMLTGQQPFPGQPYRRLSEPPAPPTVHVPTIDARWESVILRCLKIDPASRFGNAREIVGALTGTSRGSVAEDPQARTFKRLLDRLSRKHLWASAAVLVVALSTLLVRQRYVRRHPNLSGENLVVLPFSAVGGRSDEVAYCDGFTVTVTTRLAQVPSLPVTPYFEVRANNVSSVEDARAQLGASLVLIPTWQRLGDTIRITLALVDPRTNRQLQARIVDGSAGNLFALQNRVVEAAVGLLDVERPAPEPEGTAESVAYDDYIRGRGYLQRFSESKSVESAIQAFRSALKRDSKYGLAHAGLGEAYWWKFDLTRDEALVQQARDECTVAVNSGTAGAEAHICLGLVDNGTGRYEQGLEEFRRASGLEPTSDAAYIGLAQSYAGLNKPEDAEKTYRQAIALHPERTVAYNWLGMFYFGHGDYPRAVEMFSRVTGMAPGNQVFHSNLGGAYLAEGRYADAIEELENAVKITPTYYAYSNLGTAYFGLRRFSEAARNYESALHIDDTDYAVWGNLGDAYTWAPGEHEKAKTAYREAIQRAKEALNVNARDYSAQGYLATYEAMLGERQAALSALGQAQRLAPSDPDTMANAAHVYNQLGDTNRAFLWLGKALAAGYSAATVRDSPYFDNLHQDSRFAALLRDKSLETGT